MTHVQLVDQNSKSPTHGKTIVKPVTVLDAPSLFVCAIRFYIDSPFKVAGEQWAKIPKDLKIDPKTNSTSVRPEKFDDVRIVVATQPAKSEMHKKKSDVFEIGIGGGLDEKVKYAESVLGKEIDAKDIFKPGEFVDVSAVTRGYGFTGPVKRWGIRIQTRKDKQMHRHVGSIGSTVPRHVDWRVPAAGQYGFFNRTEFGKRIVLIEEDGKKVTPSGGFVGYGLPKSAILIEGSIPGPSKRLVRIRKSIRKKSSNIPNAFTQRNSEVSVIAVSARKKR